MSVKLKLSDDPVKQVINYNGLCFIDWNSSKIFNLSVTSGSCIISFTPAPYDYLGKSDNFNGNEIVISITNQSTSGVATLIWPYAVIGADTSIPAGITKLIKLSYVNSTGLGIHGTIIATTEFSAATTSSYTTAGIYNITAPIGVTKMNVIIIPSTGGGGGGAFEKDVGSGFRYLGGAGGGGGYANKVTQSLNIVAGRTYSIAVGSAGSAGAYPSGAWWDGGAGGDGGDGGTSIITDTTTQQILLSVAGGKGGKGGINPASTNPVTTIGSGGEGGMLFGAKGDDGFSIYNSTSLTIPQGGLGAINPDDNLSKGGNGGRGGGYINSEGLASAGSAGVPAKIYISYS
jgi:hypothetical protein